MSPRLHHSRDGDPDPAAVEGLERVSFEGDPAASGSDAVASLRPFGRVFSDPSLVAHPDRGAADSATLLAQADELARRGRRLEAIQTLRLLLERESKVAEPRLLVAELLAEGGDLDEAIDQLTAAEAVRPTAAILVSRGALYARSGRSAEAEQDFREAIRRDSTHCPAYRYLGGTLLRRGLTGEAIRVLREAVAMAPQDAEASLACGEALVTGGVYDEAEAILVTAAGLAPNDPRVFLQLGRLFDRQGRIDEAMAMHRKAREVGTA